MDLTFKEIYDFLKRFPPDPLSSLYDLLIQLLEYQGTVKKGVRGKISPYPISIQHTNIVKTTIEKNEYPYIFQPNRKIVQMFFIYLR